MNSVFNANYDNDKAWIAQSAAINPTRAQAPMAPPHLGEMF